MLDNSLILTPTNIALRKAFPWAYSVQKILRVAQPHRFSGRHLFFGSDFSGDHKNSNFKVYCFLVVDSMPSCWPYRQKAIRDNFLTEGRRMAFKRLDDPKRRDALVPFLNAANSLSGHIVAVLIDKRIKWLCTGKDSFQCWVRLNRMKGRWNRPAFESMVRKAQIFSLCVAQWSEPRTDVTWVTDEDEFVANERRLDDAQNFAARMSSLYSPHPLGVFAMNTTAVDGKNMTFEDLVSIPDLAAGMLSEVYTTLTKLDDWQPGNEHAIADENLSVKSQIISDWFWAPSSSLRRTAIVIERFDHLRSAVRELKMKKPIGGLLVPY